jgi:hypothetical protein
VSSGQRARLFREVNERIYELLESAEPDLPGEFLCECGQDCEQRVLLLPAAFSSLRRTGEAVTAEDCGDHAVHLARRHEPLPGGVAVPS